MTDVGYVSLGTAVAVAALGNGIVTRLLFKALVADLSRTFATKKEVEAVDQKFTSKTSRLFDRSDLHHDKLLKLDGVETRLIDPVNRILDRLDRMDERDNEHERLVERTVTTLNIVADALSRLESRVNNELTRD